MLEPLVGRELCDEVGELAGGVPIQDRAVTEANGGRLKRRELTL
jgi:hypothetical protein